MSYKEFLEKLRATPRNWALNRNGEIRANGGTSTCPGLRCNLFDPENQPVYSRRWDVAKAADKDEGYDPHIRRDLLEACGLPPE